MNLPSGGAFGTNTTSSRASEAGNVAAGTGKHPNRPSKVIHDQSDKASKYFAKQLRKELHEAVASGDLTTLRNYTDHLAGGLDQVVSYQDALGNTILHLAVQRLDQLPAREYDQRHTAIEIVRILHQRGGARADIQNYQGYTAADYAESIRLESAKTIVVDILKDKS